MKGTKGPTTQATLFLKANGVTFTDHLYAFEVHGGASVSARELGVDERAVVKTLVMDVLNAMDVIGKLPVVKGAVTRLRLENLQ